MIFYKRMTSEVKFRLILISVQCSSQRNVKWGQASGTFFIDGLQTPFTDKPFASWMIVNLLVRNNRGGRLINLTKKVTQNKPEIFCCRCVFRYVWSIVTRLIAEKNSAQDKFIPRFSLYLRHFPWLVILYIQSIFRILYFHPVNISLLFQP